MTQGGSTYSTSTYNAYGQVVETVYPGYNNARVDGVFDPSGRELGYFDGVASAWYDRDLWAAGRMFAQSYANETYFLHANELHSDAQVTNHSGAGTLDLLYYPWGQIWTHTGYMSDAHFAGFEQGASDLYATPTRHYSTDVGRWLSPDPLGGDIMNPQSLNRYAYALNNPTTFTDPSGLRCDLGPRCATSLDYFGAGWNEFGLMGIPIVAQGWSFPQSLSTINWASLGNANGEASSVAIISPGVWSTFQVGAGFDLVGLYNNPGPLPGFGPEGPRPAPIPPSMSAAPSPTNSEPDERSSCASVFWNGIGFGPSPAATEAAQQGARAASIGAGGAAWAYAASRTLTVPLRSPYFRLFTNVSEALGEAAGVVPVALAIPAFANADVATFEANRSRACRAAF